MGLTDTRKLCSVPEGQALDWQPQEGEEQQSAGGASQLRNALRSLYKEHYGVAASL